MICPKCKAEIDNDSFYCDQCGTEIMMCPKCGVPKPGKVCTSDGTKLVPAKDMAGQAAVAPSQPVNAPAAQYPVPTQPQQPVTMPKPVGAPVQAAPTMQSAPVAAQTAAPVQQGNIPILTIVNNAVNIKIQPASGDVIGRKQGPFANIFSAYPQVSGKHAQFNFNPQYGWTITDLDSANGSQYNGVKLVPMQPVVLQNNARIILANIEFIVQISGGSADNDKTVRI